MIHSYFSIDLSNVIQQHLSAWAYAGFAKGGGGGGGLSLGELRTAELGGFRGMLHRENFLNSEIRCRINK